MPQLSCPHCGSPINVGSQHAGRGSLPILSRRTENSCASVRSTHSGKTNSRRKKSAVENNNSIVWIVAGTGVAVVLAVTLWVVMRSDGGSSVATSKEPRAGRSSETDSGTNASRADNALGESTSTLVESTSQVVDTVSPTPEGDASVGPEEAVTHDVQPSNPTSFDSGTESVPQ